MRWIGVARLERMRDLRGGKVWWDLETSMVYLDEEETCNQ
jgi:hypothetical protein